MSTPEAKQEGGVTWPDGRPSHRDESNRLANRLITEASAYLRLTPKTPYGGSAETSCFFIFSDPEGIVRRNLAAVAQRAQMLPSQAHTPPQHYSFVNYYATGGQATPGKNPDGNTFFNIDAKAPAGALRRIGGPEILPHGEYCLEIRWVPKDKKVHI